MDNHKEHQVPRGTKLTAVSMGHGNHRHVFFIPLEHVNGKAILPSEVLNQVLKGVRRGTTITTG